MGAIRLKWTRPIPISWGISNGNAKGKIRSPLCSQKKLKFVAEAEEGGKALHRNENHSLLEKSLSPSKEGESYERRRSACFKEDRRCHFYSTDWRLGNEGRVYLPLCLKKKEKGARGGKGEKGKRKTQLRGLRKGHPDARLRECKRGR